MRFTILFLAVLPVLAEDPGARQIRVQSTDTIIPQVVDGGAWKTTITLVNMTDQQARYRLSFYDDNGNILPLPIIGRHGSGEPYQLGPVWVIDGAIVAHGRDVWETAAGPDAETKQGWAELTGITPAGSIGGMATLIAEATGVSYYPLSEAVVPINSANDTRMLLPFDNTNGYVSSYALVNPTQAPVTVTFTAFAPEGISTGTWQVTMQARSHTAFESPSQSFMADRMGTLDVRTSGTGIAVLGLRFNIRKAFTSFHGLSLPSWVTP